MAAPEEKKGASSEPKQQVISPVMIKLGKKTRKRVRQLKKGKGKLMNKVANTIDEICANLEDNSGHVVPVVVVVEQKRKKSRLKFGRCL